MNVWDDLKAISILYDLIVALKPGVCVLVSKYVILSVETTSDKQVISRLDIKTICDMDSQMLTGHNIEERTVEDAVTKADLRLRLQEPTSFPTIIKVVSSKYFGYSSILEWHDEGGLLT
jgi:hypothetical protein